MSATASRYEAGISTPKGDVLAKYLQILALLAVESSEIPEMHDAAGQATSGEVSLRGQCSSPSAVGNSGSSSSQWSEAHPPSAC